MIIVGNRSALNLECLNSTHNSYNCFTTKQSNIHFSSFQLIIERIQSINELIDVSLMERIASSSLDFLITSAVATVDVSAVAVDIAPLLILCMCGFIWNFVMLCCLSRFLLPNHWYVR